LYTELAREITLDKADQDCKECSQGGVSSACTERTLALQDMQQTHALEYQEHKEKSRDRLWWSSGFYDDRKKKESDVFDSPGSPIDLFLTATSHLFQVSDREKSLTGSRPGERRPETWVRKKPRAAV
jgi:hypothetical protein